MRRSVVAGALGNCVHVAGVVSFLRVAEQLDYDTEFLGAAVSVEDFVAAIKRHDPEIVGISYRLTPEVAGRLLAELKSALDREGLSNRRFLFGGTPPVCEVADKYEWIERSFTGLENPDVVWAYLRGDTASAGAASFGDTLLERIDIKHPYPLLRHHFGLPSLEATLDGVRKIAESGVLDVISVAPDQNAQECFFRPLEMDPMLDGAGGVPVRCADHLRKIYEASRCGNSPLLRIYSGTRDLINWAELATETVRNAWAAIPLCWYTALDGRSRRTPAEGIRENQQAMRWYGERGIPVEVNESHHWSLREAHDTIAVVMAYLAAYNAKKMGVRYYVSQYMFNSPPTTYGAMDLAKMLAKIEMIESLHDANFVSFRQVRAGLLHLSPQMTKAKGQLAASTALALAVKPHIIHVVGYCEGDHAADADDVIESCDIVHGVLRNCLFGMPDMTADPAVQRRKQELIHEAGVLLSALRGIGKDKEDPLADPDAIAEAIAGGIIDAPHLRGNAYAAGRLETRAVEGAIFAIDPITREILTEQQRLAALLPAKTVEKATSSGGN